MKKEILYVLIGSGGLDVASHVLAKVRDSLPNHEIVMLTEDQMQFPENISRRKQIEQDTYIILKECDRFIEDSRHIDLAERKFQKEQNKFRSRYHSKRIR